MGVDTGARFDRKPPTTAVAARDWVQTAVGKSAAEPMTTELWASPAPPCCEPCTRQRTGPVLLPEKAGPALSPCMFLFQTISGKDRLKGYASFTVSVTSVGQSAVAASVCGISNGRAALPRFASGDG